MRRRNKFGAVKTNGYASRLESKVADKLRAELAVGETLIEQVPIKFACGAKYICDFAIVRNDTGEIVRWIEAKGREMPVWRLKLRLLKHEHPVIYASLTVLRSAK